MFLIILIIVLGICWYLHAKKGIKWSHMLGAIGLGLVYWGTQSNDLMLSGSAERELRRRYGENWRQIL